MDHDIKLGLSLVCWFFKKNIFNKISGAAVVAQLKSIGHKIYQKILGSPDP
jgi:hypothetical protein